MAHPARSGALELRSDWRAFGVNFLFLLGTHAAKWVQHPLKNETHASNLRVMARQSELGFRKAYMGVLRLNGALEIHRLTKIMAPATTI